MIFRFCRMSLEAVQSLIEMEGSSTRWYRWPDRSHLSHVKQFLQDCPFCWHTSNLKVMKHLQYFENYLQWRCCHRFLSLVMHPSTSILSVKYFILSNSLSWKLTIAIDITAAANANLDTVICLLDGANQDIVLISVEVMSSGSGK